MPNTTRLFRELQALEAAHPELALPNSPTRRVGGDVSEKFVKVPHPAPILSLSNAFSADDLRAWFDRLRRLDDRVETAEFVVEPKIDGLTVVLHYENGCFVGGATRGDGRGRRRNHPQPADHSVFAAAYASGAGGGAASKWERRKKAPAADAPARAPGGARRGSDLHQGFRGHERGPGGRRAAHLCQPAQYRLGRTAPARLETHGRAADFAAVLCHRGVGQA